MRKETILLSKHVNNATFATNTKVEMRIVAFGSLLLEVKDCARWASCASVARGRERHRRVWRGRSML